MEYVDGRTLGAALEDSPGWRGVLELFEKAGRGLKAAHAAGLVHRDFKPDNVLVGHDGRVRVMDFGLARPSGEPTADTELATTEDGVADKPADATAGAADDSRGI